VHLREPGYEYKETVATGTRAAAAGGFTAVACMANTQPVNDNRSITDYIRAKAAVEGIVRVYPIGAVTRDLGGTDLAELAELAEAGCVAFSDDGKCVMNAALYRRAMEYTLPFGTPIISHAEDHHLSRGASMNEGVVSTELGIAGAAAAAEDIMVARDILLAELTGAHVHIAHLSTAGAVRLVRDAKARGVRVTAEVTPHHLLLTEDAVRSFDANTKMNPPLRSKRDTEVLLEALVDGKPGALSLTTLVSRLSRDPARLLGLPGGSLAPGAAADLTLLDPAAEWTVDPARFASRSRNTPFGGWTLKGRPWKTIVGGGIVWE
jgi:dihydroorotase